jgi:hypothetical protein
MAYPVLKTETNDAPAIRVVKGKEEYEGQVNYLTGLAWQIAYTAFMFGRQ